MSGCIDETGQYYAQVIFSEDDNWKNTVSSAMSEALHYTRPSATVSLPSQMGWDSEKTGTFNVSAVDHAEEYIFYLYKRSSADSDWEWIEGNGVDKLSWDYSSNITDQNAEYAVRIYIESDNINEYANSKESDYIILKQKFALSTDKRGTTAGELTKGAAEAVEAAADHAASNGGSKEAALAAVDDIKKENQKDVQIAVQSNSSVQNAIKKLDEMTGIKVDAKAEDGTGVDASKISMIGAALNAADNNVTEMTLNIQKLPEDNGYRKLYKNAVALNFDLSHVRNTDNLAVPVRITMPIPEGMNRDRLRIFHYKTDGGVSEYSRENNLLSVDGNMVTFTVTHFSPIVFTDDEVKESSGSSNKGKGCDHDYVWSIENKATDTQDALMVKKCRKCGHVDGYMKARNTAYAQFLLNAQDKIRKAPKDSTVVLDTTLWTSMNKALADVISSRPDVSVKIKYTLKGERKAMVIPAGTDLTEMLDDNGYIGFSRLQEKYGVPYVYGEKD